jgi:hypothetical protein
LSFVHRAASKRRLGIFSRTLAAIVGGYALAALFAVACSVASRDARADAVLIGMLSSFAVYVCAFLWCFAAASALRAWLGLLSCALLLAAATVLALLRSAS